MAVLWFSFESIRSIVEHRRLIWYKSIPQIFITKSKALERGGVLHRRFTIEDLPANLQGKSPLRGSGGLCQIPKQSVNGIGASGGCGIRPAPSRFKFGYQPYPTPLVGFIQSRPSLSETHFEFTFLRLELYQFLPARQEG